MYVLIISGPSGPVSAFGPYGDESEAMSAGDTYLASNGGGETSLSVRVLALESKVES